MTAIFLDRIDAAPLDNEQFSYVFNAWVSNTIDSLNEVIVDIQDEFNGVGIPYGPTRLTQAQIVNLNALNQLEDGVFIYCIDHIPPCYVGRISGALVQFTTAAFP